MNRGCATTSRATSAADTIAQGSFFVLILWVCSRKYEVPAAKLLWVISMQ